MSNELLTATGEIRNTTATATATLATATITEADVRRAVQHVQMVQMVVASLMKPDIDYGTIPGIARKFLFKPGAEKLALAFSFTPEYFREEIDLGNGHREQRTVCRLIHRPTGGVVGECSATCSTMESKYRWRGAAGKACPACGENAMKRGRPDWGGGYYCSTKLGGCDAKFKAGTPEAQHLDKIQTEGRLENPDLADTYHTVRLMSEKRAFVGAVRAATACSDIFDYDPGTMDGDDRAQAPPPLREPQRRPPRASTVPAGAPSPSQSSQRPAADLASQPPLGQSPPAAPNARPISEAQRKRIFAKLAEHKLTQDAFKKYLFFVWDLDSTTKITADIYDQCVAWIETGGFQPGEEPVT